MAAQRFTAEIIWGGSGAWNQLPPMMPSMLSGIWERGPLRCCRTVLSLYEACDAISASGERGALAMT
jgi:hypothetical protein